MKGKYFTENKYAWYIAEDAIIYGTKLTNEQLKKELTTLLERCRSYASSYRQGAFDYLINLPCGYQDSHGDKVSDMYRKLEVLKVLKVLYRLRQGDATRWKKHVDKALGIE